MNGTPGPGHNQPPESPIDRAASLVANANRWIAERPTIADNDTAGRAQDFVTQLRETKADLEAAWKAEREPHDKAIGELKTRYRTPLELVGIALTRMGEKLTPWLNAEQDRLREEAEQLRVAAAKAAADVERAKAEAASSGTIEAELAARRAADDAKRLAKAASKPPARARVKGDLSRRAMTLHANWHAEVVDPDKALKFYGRDPTVRAAALQAATRIASDLATETKDESKAPPGFRFVRTERAT
jgi:hypothetical protein